MSVLDYARNAAAGTLLPVQHPVTQARQWKCGVCSFRVKLAPGVPEQCRKCWCFVAAKTRVPEESCPEGYW